MNPLDISSGPRGWFTRGAPLALAVLTAIALGVPAVHDFELHGFDRFTLSIFFGALLLVAVASLVQTRFMVIPGLLRQFTESARTPDIEKLSNTVSSVAFAFAVSPGFYGVIFSVCSGMGALALPLDAVGFTIYLVLWRYLSAELERLRRDKIAGGE